MKLPPYLFLLLLLITLLFPSCAATGFGRPAPKEVEVQGPAKAFVWSVMTAPEWWDEKLDPLELPGGPLEHDSQQERRKSPAYWTLYAFSPEYH